MDFLNLSHSDRVWGGHYFAPHHPRRTKAIAGPEPAESAGAARTKKTPPIRALVQWSYHSQAIYTHRE